MRAPTSSTRERTDWAASAFITRDRRFAAVLGDELPAPIVETDPHEGLVYAADEDALYFTTTRSDTVAIRRLDLVSGVVSTLRKDSNTGNGMALAHDGRLVVCEQGTLTSPARITRVDRASGAVETVVDALHGSPLNSPNDVVVKSDGTIWFTDPSYGYLQGFRPEPYLPDSVYRYNPRTDVLSVAADFLDKPNGLAFSPDERVLYVGDNGAPHQLLAFDVMNGDALAGRRVVATSTPEHPDGLKVDCDGRIYASFAHGIQVLSPEGDLLGEIRVPGAVNFTFGGPGRNVLYVTADTAIWAVALNTKGA